MRVWVTKYALTKGILPREVEVCEGTSIDMVKVLGGNRWAEHYHGEGREWHRTRESATKRAAEMRDKKLKSLRKQIARLENMDFT